MKTFFKEEKVFKGGCSETVHAPNGLLDVSWGKRSLRALVIAALALGSLASARAAVETYDLDPAHTSVGFTVSHFFTKVPGNFTKVKGTIVVDRDHLENSTVEAVIEVASINTNTGMRDDHLRSTTFFDAKFPAMTFKSKAWKSAGGNTYAVTGVLTMKGVAKEVVLKVSSLGFGPGMAHHAMGYIPYSEIVQHRVKYAA